MGVYIEGMEMPKTCRECSYCWAGLKSCDAKYGLPVGDRWDIEIRCRACDYDNAIIQIDALPSADTEWIPCSERLPEKRRSVLITTSEGFVGEACYWETTENHVIWKGYRWNATYWDDEVLAWMPLPTPYREENEE